MPAHVHLVQGLDISAWGTVNQISVDARPTAKLIDKGDNIRRGMLRLKSVPSEARKLCNRRISMFLHQETLSCKESPRHRMLMLSQTTGGFRDQVQIQEQSVRRQFFFSCVTGLQE